MRMHKYACRNAALFVTAGLLGSVQAQTWVYDPDLNVYPNDTGQPFEGGSVSGPNSTRSLIDLGGGDYVLQFDTGSGQGADVSSYFQAPAASWNVTSATGYSVEWKVKLDPVAITNRSAAGVFAGNASDWAFMRIFNEFTNPFNGQNYLQAQIQSADGNAGAVSHNLGNMTGWHTYRMDVQGGTAKLYVDEYHTPVLTKTLIASGADAIWFGDGTGVDNGKYQVDRLATWQGGVVGAPALPNAAVINRTLLHASYDGNTGNNGMDADYARGTNVAIGNGGAIQTPGQFGSVGGMNPWQASGTVNYAVEDNFTAEQGTVEMWVKTETWNNGGFYGFFDVYNAGVVDIRIQKTNANRLQAYVADVAGGSSWSITSEPLALDTDWHHIAWSWDENVNMSFLYLDGVPIANNTNMSISNLTGVDFLGSLTGATIEVGSIQGGSAAFEGLLDEFRISNYDLYQGGTFTPQNAPFALQQWAVDGDGSWSNASNWTGNVVPNYLGATANFLDTISNNTAVEVDGLQTVGRLRFDSPMSYTLGGTGTLIVDVGSLNASINVAQGSHVIDVPILLARNLDASVAANSTLTVNGDVQTPGGVTLTKTGDGTMIMKNLRMDGVDAAAGTLRISAKGAHNDPSGVSVVKTVAAAGKLDLTNNAMAIDYDGGSTLSSVQSLVQSAYAGGAWTGNGLTSSSAAAQAATSVKTALAVYEADVAGDFFGQGVDDTTVLVQYALSADATLDGKVDTQDFNMLAGSFGASGADWKDGDFTYDGVVDSNDYNALVGNYGNTMPAAAPLGAAVPEPAMGAVALLLPGLLLRRKR